MGKDFTNGAYEAIYTHPRWKEEATKYEENLAAKLFHMSYTKNAVKTALGKISRILTGYYGDGGKSLNAREEETVENAAGITNLAELFGEQGGPIPVNKTLVTALMQERRDNSSAGQVNKVMAGDNKENDEKYTQEEADQANMETLDAIMNKDGNLREQMTLLYNGMFINGGRSSKQIKSGTSFKGLLMNISRKQAGKSNSEALRGINFDLLEGLDQYKKGKDVFDTYSMARDLETRSEKIQGKGNAVSRWFRSIKRRWSSSVYNFFHRKKREQPLVEGEVGLGLNHYERLGIGLSDREKAFAYTTSENETDGKKRLRWKEGQVWTKMKKDLTANGMLQLTGPSGTTLRMLGAYRLMGASQKELLDFRLALIAWMVSSHDHSLYEILQGSHNAGVRGTESLKEPAVMYTNIDPLDTQMLRDNFAENKQFPHEVIFKMQLDELKAEREENEKHNGRSAQRANTQREYDEVSKEVEEFQQICKRYTDKIARLKKKKTSLEIALEKNKKLTEDDKKKNIEKINKKTAKIKILEEVLNDVYKPELNEALERKKKIQLMPEMTLFAKSAATQGTSAMALNAQDIALNIYTTGAYMTMNVGMKWGKWLGKRKLWDERVDEEKFGSYQSSYKDETKNKKLMDKIFALTRVAARMSQDALEERGSREMQEVPAQQQAAQQQQAAKPKKGKKKGANAQNAPAVNAEPDYMHAAVVNTFRGEKSSGDFYQKEGAEYETNALTSTSKSLDKALLYFGKSVEKNGYDKSVLALYQMTGMGAVDITDLSKVANEQEVLVPSGTRFRVRAKLVKNVKVDDLKTDPEKAIEDTDVKEADLAQEFTPNEQGKIGYDQIKHVNVVKLVEVDGPGARKRRKANETRWRRLELMQSLAQ